MGWLSFPKIRSQLFEELIRFDKNSTILSDDLVKQIREKRDERERLLLKLTMTQLAIYVALLVAPGDAGIVPVLGLPFKAVREVLLFVLSLINLLTILVASRMKIMNEFLLTYRQIRTPLTYAPIYDLSMGSYFNPYFWFPLPLDRSLRRTRTVSVITKIMLLLPFVFIVLLFLLGVVTWWYIAVEVWKNPTLPLLLSRTAVLLFIITWLSNLLYALADNLPLPYEKR